MTKPRRPALIRRIKRMLPATLFGRALLIMVLPTVLVQLVAIYMFYERHWDSVVRNMSSALAGEVRVLVDAYSQADARSDGRKKLKKVVALGDMMGIGVWVDGGRDRIFKQGVGQESYPEFFDLLERELTEPFMVQRLRPDGDILISILMQDGILQLQTSKKRLVSSTTYIFLFWMVGSALLLSVVAMVFLRNQIRPMRQLAYAAEQLGLGRDVQGFSPRGALEVRQAGRAFVEMRERIRRQVASRTEMLAGISHDLRTPLTRLRLQLALMKLDEAVRREIQADLEEMEHMIQAYLDFARSEGGERSEQTDLCALVRDVVEGYARQNQPVTLADGPPVPLSLKPKAMRRALQNVIDNALRYGHRADVSVYADAARAGVRVADAGPGIPEEKQESVFRPFTRLDPSRNSKTGGVGLGLSIARDVMQAHGGTVALHNRPEGGLMVDLSLPQDAAVH